MRGPLRTLRSPESPVRRGVFLLPSLLTTGNLLAGFYSIMLTFAGDFQRASVFILIAHVFDGLDGRVARFTRTTSRFGIEYDSLADLVAFGVAPALLAYAWALAPWGQWGWLAASLFVTCGALRLARFNVQLDSVEKRSFVGLPVPAAAGVIVSVVLFDDYLGGTAASLRQAFVLVLFYALAGLMVSNIRYFSFKELPFRRRQAFWILIVAIIIVQLAIAMPQVVLFTFAIGYVLSGPLRALVALRRWRRRRARVAAAA